MADKPHNKANPIEQVVWVGSGEDQTRQVETPAPPEPASPAPDLSASPPLEALPTNGIAVKNQSKVLAQTIISTFTERLKAEAQKRGGFLTADDIDQLSLEFDRKREALENVFQQSFEQYVRLRERAAFDHARQFPFDRVIVNTFAALFSPDRVADDGAGAVTRHVLPGFFMALDKMIGPESMEEYQARCRLIVDRLSKGDESELDWAEIYDDPESKKVCFDALVTFAPYFEDITKRQEWFLPIANNNLASDSDWELSASGFRNLVDEMFSDLKRDLAAPDSRKILEKQYSGVTCFELDRAFEKMAKG